MGGRIGLTNNKFHYDNPFIYLNLSYLQSIWDFQQNSWRLGYVNSYTILWTILYQTNKFWNGRLDFPLCTMSTEPIFLLAQKRRMI